MLVRTCAMRGRDKTNPSYRGKSNTNFVQMLEVGEDISNSLTTVQKDSMVIEIGEPKVLAPNNFSHKAGDGTGTRKRTVKELVPALQANEGDTQRSYIITKVWDGYNQRIRADSSVTGTLTGNCGADLKRNGQGIVEILALDEQNKCYRKDTFGTLTTDGSSPKHNNRVVEIKKGDDNHE